MNLLIYFMLKKVPQEDVRQNAKKSLGENYGESNFFEYYYSVL